MSAFEHTLKYLILSVTEQQETSQPTVHGLYGWATVAMSDTIRKVRFHFYC